MAQTPSPAVADPSAASSLGTVSSGNSVSSLSYEQARDELVTVVTELEQGSSTLERSLALWERGEALAARCEEWLLGAKERLEKARRVESAE